MSTRTVSAANRTPGEKRYRLLNKNGTFNIARPASNNWRVTDLYHGMLSAPWSHLLLKLVLTYLAVNALFAGAYLLAGPGALDGVEGTEVLDRISGAFFFSVQTLATIGYGKITPHGLVANLLVTVEALFGLMGVALATGLLFARFSKPTARVIFSDIALITEIDGVRCFIFRIANRRFNQIVEAQISVVLAINEKTAEGEEYRNFYDLELERSRSPMFALTWTVIHPITDQSPLRGQTAESLETALSEIVVSMTGIDDTFAQTIHARASYLPAEIVWGKYFEDMLTRRDGMVHVALDRIHSVRG